MVGSVVTTSDDEDNTNSEIENSDRSNVTQRGGGVNSLNRVHRKSISSSANNSGKSTANAAPTGGKQSNVPLKNVQMATSPSSSSPGIQTTYYYNNSVNEQQAKLISPMSKPDGEANGGGEQKADSSSTDANKKDTEAQPQIVNGLPTKSPPVTGGAGSMPPPPPPPPLHSTNQSMSFNNLYYQHVMPPFTLIDGQNLFALANGGTGGSQQSNGPMPPPPPNPMVGHQFGAFQQGGPIPFHLNPAAHPAHLTAASHHHMAQQPPPGGHFLNLIPILPPGTAFPHGANSAPSNNANQNWVI